jgi:hypothetical protein
MARGEVGSSSHVSLGLSEPGRPCRLARQFATGARGERVLRLV